MAPRGLKPSLITFHTLLKDPSYLKAAGLRDLYAQMMATEGLLLTEVTFHYVFRAAYKCTSGLPAAWLFQVTSDFCWTGLLAPTSPAYTSACDAGSDSTDKSPLASSGVLQLINQCCAH